MDYTKSAKKLWFFNAIQEKAAIFIGRLNYRGKLTENTRSSATARLNEGETKRLRFSHSQVWNECSFIVSDTLSWVAHFIAASPGISGDRSPLLKPPIFDKYWK